MPVTRSTPYFWASSCTRREPRRFCGYLGPEVPAPLIWGAHVGEYDAVDVLAEDASRVQPHSGQAQPLPVYL